MPNSQLQWIKEATGDVKVLRAMVVGWQTVLQTLESTVMRFNSQYFGKTDDPNREMKVIAAKQTVIATLRELRLRLDKWRDRLKTKGFLSQETMDLFKQIRPTLDRIHEFRDVRNCAFHFGDPLEPPDDLVDMYEYVQGFDLDDLNEMLRALTQYGMQMREDAALNAEQLEKKSGS